MKHLFKLSILSFILLFGCRPDKEQEHAESFVSKILSVPVNEVNCVEIPDKEVYYCDVWRKGIFVCSKTTGKISCYSLSTETIESRKLELE